MAVRVRNPAQIAMWNELKGIIARDGVIADIKSGLRTWKEFPAKDWSLYMETFADDLTPASKQAWSDLNENEKLTFNADALQSYKTDDLGYKEVKAIPPSMSGKEGLITDDLQTDEPPSPRFKPAATKTNQAPKQVVGSTVDPDGEEVKQIADLPSDKSGTGVTSSGVSSYDLDATMLASTDQLINDGNELLDQIENGTATNPVETRNRLNEIVTNIEEARNELNNTTMSASFEDDQRLTKAQSQRKALKSFEDRLFSVDGSDANDPSVGTGTDATVDSWVDKIGGKIIKDKEDGDVQSMIDWRNTEADLSQAPPGKPPVKYRSVADEMNPESIPAGSEDALARSRIATPDEAIGENVDIQGTPVLLEGDGTQNKLLFSFIPANDDIAHLNAGEARRVYIRGDVVNKANWNGADLSGETVIKYGTDHYMMDPEKGFRKLLPQEWESMRSGYERDVIASDKDAMYAAVNDTLNLMESQPGGKSAIHNLPRTARSEKELMKYYDPAAAGDNNATLFVWDDRRQGLKAMSASEAIDLQVPSERRMYVRPRIEDATNNVNTATTIGDVRASIKQIFEMPGNPFNGKANRAGISTVPRSSKPNSLESHPGASLGTSGSSLTQGSAAAQDLATMFRQVGTQETRELQESTQLGGFLKGFKERQDRGRSISNLFMDDGAADGGRPGVTLAMDPTGKTVRTDSNGNPIILSRQFDASDPDVADVSLPQDWAGSLKPPLNEKGLPVGAISDEALSNVVEYLNLEAKIEVLSQQVAAGGQGTMNTKFMQELSDKRDELWYGLTNSGKLDIDDVINQHADYAIATLMEGRAVGGQTKRAGGSADGAPGVNTGYSSEGVPTGERNPDGTPIMTTPAPVKRAKERSFGFKVNEREGGVSTIGDVASIRADITKASDFSMNTATGLKIDDETMAFHTLPTGQQALAARIGERFDSTAAKSLEHAFLEEYLGLRSEGYGDLRALQDIANTLMKAGFAPTREMVEAARSKVRDLGRRAEAAQQQFNGMAGANVVPYESTLSHETFKGGKDSAKALSELHRAAQVEVQKLLDAQAKYPEFSATDIDKVEFPQHAVAVLSGMSEQDRAALDPMIAKMFANEGDRFGTLPEDDIPQSVEELLSGVETMQNFDPKSAILKDLEVASRNLAEASRRGASGDQTRRKEALAQQKFLRGQLNALKNGQPLDARYQSNVMPGSVNSRTYTGDDFKPAPQDGSAPLLRLMSEAFRERGAEVPGVADTNMGSRQGQVSPADIERLRDLEDSLAHPEEIITDFNRRLGNNAGEAEIKRIEAEKRTLEDKILAAANGSEISKSEVIMNAEAMADESVSQSLTTLFASDGKMSEEAQRILAQLWNADPMLESLPDENELSAVNRLFQEFKNWGAGGNPLKMSREEYQDGILDLLTSSYMESNLGGGTGAQKTAVDASPISRFDTDSSMKSGNPNDPVAGSTSGGRLPTDGDNSGQQARVSERRSDLSSKQFSDKYRSLSQERRMYRDALRKLESADTNVQLGPSFKGQDRVNAGTQANREFYQKKIDDITLELDAKLEEFSQVTGVNPRVSIQTDLTNATIQPQNPKLGNLDATPGGGRTQTLDNWNDYVVNTTTGEEEGSSRLQGLNYMKNILQGQEKTQKAVRTPAETQSLLARVQREVSQRYPDVTDEDIAKFDGMLRDMDSSYVQDSSPVEFEQKSRGVDLPEETESVQIPTALNADSSALKYEIPEITAIDQQIQSIENKLDNQELPRNEREVLITQYNNMVEGRKKIVRASNDNGEFYVNDANAQRILSNILDGTFTSDQIDVGRTGNPLLGKYADFTPDQIAIERSRLKKELPPEARSKGSTRLTGDEARSKDNVSEPVTFDDADTGLGSQDPEALETASGEDYMDTVANSAGGTEGSASVDSDVLSTYIKDYKNDLIKNGIYYEEDEMYQKYIRIQGELEALDQVENPAKGDNVFQPDEVATQLVYVKETPYLEVTLKSEAQLPDSQRGIRTGKKFYLPIEGEPPKQGQVGNASKASKMFLKDGQLDSVQTMEMGEARTTSSVTEVEPRTKVSTTDQMQPAGSVDKMLTGLQGNNTGQRLNQPEVSPILGPGKGNIIKENVGKTPEELAFDAWGNQQVTAQTQSKNKVENGSDEGTFDPTSSSQNTRNWSERMKYLKSPYFYVPTGGLALGALGYGIARATGGNEQVPLNETKTGPEYESDRQVPTSADNIRANVPPPVQPPVQEPVPEPVQELETFDDAMAPQFRPRRLPAQPDKELSIRDVI